MKTILSLCLFLGLPLWCLSQINCQPIDSFHLQLDFPHDISWDGQSFWAGSRKTVFYKYDNQGILIDSVNNPIPNAYMTTGLAYDNGFLWALDWYKDSVYQINPISEQIVNQFYTGETLMQGLCIIGDVIYLSGSDIICINKQSGNIIKTIPFHKRTNGLAALNENLLVIHFDGSANRNHFLYQIDTLNGSIIDSAALCVKFPLGITVKNDDVWINSHATYYGGTEMAYQFPLYITSLTEKDLMPSIQVFPNPSTQEFTITTTNAFENIQSIELYNSKGKLLSTPQLNSIQKSFSIHEPKGVYFLKLKLTNDDVKVVKLIKY